MRRLEVSTLIDRSTQDVFPFIGDAENGSEWSTHGTHYVKTTQGPIGVGTAFRFTGKFMGRRVDGTRTITEYRPNDTIGFRQDKPIAFAGHYTFEPVGRGTRLTFAVEGDVPGVYGLIRPIFERTSRQLFEKDLRKLKGVLDAAPIH